MQVIVHGATGHMGRCVLKLLDETPGFELAAAVSPELTTDPARQEYYSLPEYQGPADLIIDFSFHGATHDLMTYALQRQLPVIVCTTGQTEAEKAEYEEAQDKLEEERAEIGRQIQANAQELEDLQEEIEKAIQEYEAAEAAEAAAAATIANMIAEYQRKKAEEAAANQSAIIDQMNQANQEAIANGEEPPYSDEDIQNATNSGSQSGGATSTGSLTWPVPCSTRVTSRFGYRSDPFTGANTYHNGIDIDGFNNDGNIIVAAADGTVITASYDSAYGNYVVIDHGDMTTLYAHMSGMAVSAGDYVSAGQTIGYLGDTGRATGTHCHFEVFVGGSRVDPASYFSGLTYYNC